MKNPRTGFCCPLTGVTMAAGKTRLVFQAPAGFYNWRIAGNGSGYHRDFFMLFRFCCLSVLHAANIGVVNFHSLWCVLGPLYFLFMHHNLLDEEPQQLRCQRLNVRVPLRFVEEGCRRVPPVRPSRCETWNRRTSSFRSSSASGFKTRICSGRMSCVTVRVSSFTKMFLPAIRSVF